VVNEKVLLTTVPAASTEAVAVADPSIRTAPAAIAVAAFAGTIDKRPKPKAETATSDIRLSVFFVDISVLSFQSRVGTFPISAI